MSLITLTTDLGFRDNYVALLKAYIYKHLPDCKLVDISHEIEKFNLQQTAYVFGNVFHEFPEHTIHILAVKSSHVQHKKNLIVYYKKQYIVCPDNGLFSLFYDGTDVVYHELNNEIYSEGLLFARNPLAQVAVELASGKFITDMAIEISEIVQHINFQPVSNSDSITGRCIYIDSFGNVITNIKKELFDQICKGRNTTIYLPNTRIFVVSKSYDDAQPNEPLALFNSSGNLEIALKMGSAKQMLFPRNFLSHTDFQITVEFHS